MENNFVFVFVVSFLAILMLSSIFFLPAHAYNPWIGNDNEEFGNPDCVYCTYTDAIMHVDAYLTSDMIYSSGNGHISLQYNPDWDTSKTYKKTRADWFQMGIVGGPSNCVIFTIQVYPTGGGNLPYEWFSNNAQCTTVNGMYDNQAYWTIDEFTNANGYIDQVNFYLSGGGTDGGYYSYDVNIPSNCVNGQCWFWFRSNICWCGTDYESANFKQASGTIYYSELNANFKISMQSPRPMT